MTGGWKKLCNEKLQNLYFSPNIRMNKSRRMRWAGHVEHMGEMRNAYKFWMESLEGKVNFEGLGIDERILAKLGLIWLGVGTGGGLL
jgi:hypothetical protein